VECSPDSCGEESDLQSHEVVREALDKVGAKVVAQEMGLSYSTVSKWGEVPSKEGEKGSGSRNPLDRVDALYQVTKHKPVIEWLCNRAGGFFVENPPCERSKELAKEFVAHTREMVREFYRLLEVFSESFENDGRIDEEEAKRIRTEWEKLKSIVASFVFACEKQYYS
jgi:hypothetical protein